MNNSSPRETIENGRDPGIRRTTQLLSAGLVILPMAVACALLMRAETPQGTVACLAVIATLAAVWVAKLNGGSAKVVNPEVETKDVLSEFGSDAQFSIEADGRYLRVNPRMSELTGYAPEELAGMSVEHLEIEHGATDLRAMLEGLPIGQSRFLRGRCRRKNDGPLPVEIHLRTVEYEGRRMHFGSLRDISDRLADSAKTDANQSRYRMLVEHATDAFLLHDEEGRLIDVNDSACTALGYSRAELLEMSLPDVDAEFSGPASKVVWGMLANDEPVTIYGRHRRKDGSEFPVEVHTRVFMHEGRRLFLALARDISERKAAEAALRESEERFQAFMNQSPVVAWLKDDTYRYRYVNSAFEKLFDRREEDIIDREDHEIYPEEFAQVTRQNDVRVLENSEVLDTIEKVPGADGVLRHWLVQKFPLRRSGAAAWVGGTAVDVTDRIKAETALTISENRHRTIIESEPECVKLLSRDMILLEMNPAGLGMVEAESADEVIGQDVTVLVDEPDRDAFIQVNRDAFEGKTGHLEFRLTGLRGTQRWMETNVAPLRDQDGHVTAALSITREVTEKKRSEELLMNLLRGTAASSANDFFRTLVQVLSESLKVQYAFVGEIKYAFDGENVSTVGSSVETLCCWDGHKFIENFEYELKHTPCNGVADGTLCHYRDGVIQKFPQDHLLAEMKIESYLGVPLKASDGRTIGLLVVMDTKPMPPNDKTEAIFQIFAARAGAELDRALAARHEQELEAELRHAQKLESIGTMAGGIAHDFNNIVASILGNAELAAEDVGADHPAVESLEEIISSSNRAKELVEQILTFGRREPPVRRVMDIAPVVKDTTAMLRSMIPAGVDLNCRISPDLPKTVADPERIRQLIVNLCTNSWQSTGEMEGHILISLDLLEVSGAMARENSDLHQGPYLCLAVRDDGAGMDESLVKRAFDPFFTTKEPGNGTGLGLSVVDGIVRDHDGKIRVESSPGMGSTFSILLPAVEDLNALSAPTEESGEGRRILYVDDEESLVHIAERALKRLDYQCSGFNDPVAGRQSFAAAPENFDAVIVDFNMPKLNGLKLIEEIRRIRPETPIILSSGNFTAGIIARAEAMGVTEFLFKPHSTKALNTSLQRVLSQSAR